MKAEYRIIKNPEFLRLQDEPDPYHVLFLCDGRLDWEYIRRAKVFYTTQKEAEAAGKRYLRRMKKNGFEI